MVVLPPGSDGGGEGRDGWVASAWRHMAGALSVLPSSSRFRYEPIGDPRERDRGKACGASNNNNNTRRKQGGSSSDSSGNRSSSNSGSSSSSSSSSSSRSPLQKGLVWGALFCAAGLVVTVNNFRRYSPTSSAPPPSSSSSRLSSLPPIRPKTTGSREEAVSFPADAKSTTSLGSSVGDEASVWESHSTSLPRSWNIRVSNKYQTATDRDGQKQKLMYPWGHIAEPYADTRLEVANFFPGDEDDDGGVKFRWEMDGSVLGHGATITTVFRTPGLFNCSVTAYREDKSPNTHGIPGSRVSASLGDGARGAGESATEEFVVAVKYVRREIRSLTDRDREVFFNAMAVMQRVPSAVGRAVYGRKYYSKDYFNRMHLYYGGARNCDHWHAGPGFVTSHIALTLMFEQSLQSVNPSIALPYWDFTIEGTHFDWTNFRLSSVFSDDWFGQAAPDNELKTPERGRFGFVPTMVDAKEYSQSHNAYGMLRSPWNNDPNPFMTRHDHETGFVNNKKPSGCEEYRDSVLVGSWMELAVWLNFGAHGHIHELLGGTWSKQATAFAVKVSDITQLFAHNSTPLQRYLWRAGYMEGPAECAMTQPWEECKVVCSPSAFGEKTPAEILMDSGVLGDGVFFDKDFTYIDSLTDGEGRAFEAFPGYTKEETGTIYFNMLDALCTPMKIGTHYQATSTNDPTFWVIHPTFDRLWHLHRLEIGPLFDQTWKTDSTVCYGHNPDDTQPFHDLFPLEGADPATTYGTRLPMGSEVAGVKVYYTNAELYAQLKPDEMSSPYTYDNFDWPHCEETGVFIRVPH